MQQWGRWAAQVGLVARVQVAKQQQAQQQAQKKSQNIKRGFDRIWSEALQRESQLKRIRTKTQRLKVYGLWFIETAVENPYRTGGKFILNMLHGAGPYGQAIAGAIATIISAHPVIIQIIQSLGAKGGPLNQDWKRVIQEEVNGMLTLEEQWRRDRGLDWFIVSENMGYRPIDETAVYNNKLHRDELRLNKLTQEEKVRVYV